MLRISIIFLSLFASLPLFAQLYVPELKVQQSFNGRIGIGTSNPYEDLTIEGGVSTYIGVRSSGGKWIKLGATGSGGGILGPNTTDMYFKDDGEVKIGVNQPNNTLVIRSNHYPSSKVFASIQTGDFTGKINIGVDGVSGFIYTPEQGNLHLGAGGYHYTRGVKIETNGNVAIGYLWANNYKLKVNGSAYCNGQWIGSDIKLKKNIAEFSKGLSLVKEMKPIKYELKSEVDSASAYNKESGNKPKIHKYVSVVAQELQKSAPELVETFLDENNEETLAINQTAITYVLVNAVKELNAKVEEQQRFIEALQNKK